MDSLYIHIYIYVWLIFVRTGAKTSWSDYHIIIIEYRKLVRPRVHTAAAAYSLACIYFQIIKKLTMRWRACVCVCRNAKWGRTNTKEWKKNVTANKNNPICDDAARRGHHTKRLLLPYDIRARYNSNFCVSFYKMLNQFKLNTARSLYSFLNVKSNWSLRRCFLYTSNQKKYIYINIKITVVVVRKFV